MMYAHQIITLYTLNFYSAICQLYLNKTGRKKKKFPIVGNGKNDEKLDQILRD